MNRLARLGFILLGIHGLFAGLRSVANMVAEGNLEGGVVPQEYLSLVVLVGLLLDLSPPIALIVFNRRLADMIFSTESPGDAQPTASALFSAGIAVLGLYLAIVGLAGLVGSVGALALSWELRENPHFVYNISSGAASSATYMILGSALYYWGPRVARRLDGSPHSA